MASTDYEFRILWRLAGTPGSTDYEFRTVLRVAGTPEESR
jgi:hypothetical protein